MLHFKRVLVGDRNDNWPVTVVVAIVMMQLAGCSKLQPGTGSSGDSATEQANEDFVSTDEDTTPQEREYLRAGKPFLVALAGGRYDQAYLMLSSHARGSTNQEQFLTPTGDVSESKTTPVDNLTVEKFAQQMEQVAKRYGPPHSPTNLYVESSDPEVLAGRGDALERMFAIGGMPASIPTNIRKASLRGRVQTKLTGHDIQKLAKEYNMAPEAIAKDEEMQPYYNIKFVLVEDEGTLKVGYFEIMPPSMLD